MLEKFHPDSWTEPKTKEEKQAATEILTHELICTEAFSSTRLKIAKANDE